MPSIIKWYLLRNEKQRDIYSETAYSFSLKISPVNRTCSFTMHHPILYVIQNALYIENTSIKAIWSTFPKIIKIPNW